jgi:hypothetical protein
LRPLLLILTSTLALAAPEEVTVKELKNLTPEKCLQLPPADIVTRCPQLAGRFLTLDAAHVALLDRTDRNDRGKGTQLCEEHEGAWHCRRVVVLEYEMHGAKKRDPKFYLGAGELVRQIATAPRVKLGDEFGALQAPMLPPKTCLDVASRGCAVQAIRLRARAPDKVGGLGVRRRLWLVEDADGTTLTCSDATLTRCDELNAGGWAALALTLRPSSLAPPEPPPEIDPPTARTDRRAVASAAGGDGADSSAGAGDAWLRPKSSVALPKAPSRADVAKTAHALETAGRGCVAAEEAAVAVGVIFSGEGSLLSLSIDGAPADDPKVSCLTAAARKLSYPRFAGNTYHLSAMVLPRARLMSADRAKMRRGGSAARRE